MSPLALATAACMLASFLVCGIPFGLLIAKGSREHVDVRTVGSGNIGMTNVARSAGAAAAALTLACDAGKGMACMLLSHLALSDFVFGGDWAAAGVETPFGWALALVYLSCVMGHVFSPYLGFRGGKGISVGFGAALGLHWPLALAILAVFFVLAIPSRYVSLGSVAAAAALPVVGALMGFGPWVELPLAVTAVVVIWSHRTNLRKLARGEERRFSVHRGSSDKRDEEGGSR
ncbi:hypothetical protein HMPREF1008_01559 [Olsenella sp. oral taxon 809 str. F0356]|uniref:glycerol-3-phosphate acyltransferase n=1 Tax=Olsenella sp. oral taxon 809 TaxID=661086 RepID=UPI000231EEB6|nr:glycerol-3-phosphate acyltransferase [Olsenella sp. oral taxon 809]EHF01935.1 hypothetical protein HMPREF1008_01559 [Olsenella sp. oral taxon 809 str. F0356]